MTALGTAITALTLTAAFTAGWWACNRRHEVIERRDLDAHFLALILRGDT